MDVNECCNYDHMDTFGRTDKERVKKDEREVEVAGKRPNE